MNRKCETCYYSKPSMNSELVVCSYMDDILSHGQLLDSSEEWKSARYFSRLTNFSGDAYEAFAEVDGVPQKKLCVSKGAICGKWVQGRD